MRSARAYIAAAALASSLIGCAAADRQASASFSTQPTAVAPRLAFVWHDQLTSVKYLGTEGREYARPAHVGATDELVVATSEGEVVKYQAGNGRAIWRTRLDGVFHAGPAVGGGYVYVASLEGALYALHLQNGAPAWQAQLPNSVESRATYAQGRLFVSDAADQLRAFDAATGEPIWTYTRTLPEYFTVKGTCTPTADRDAVYCGFSDGVLAALQVDTGELLWEVDLSGGARNFADVDGAVRVLGDKLLATSYAGGVYLLERDSGAPIWRAAVESVADVTVADGRVYVASAVGRVVALGLDDGEPLWGFRLKDTSPGALAAYGPYVLAFTTQGPVFVLDAESGYPHTKWVGTSGFGGPVESGSSRVYALTNFGQLLGLKLGY